VTVVLVHESLCRYHWHGTGDLLHREKRFAVVGPLCGPNFHDYLHSRRRHGTSSVCPSFASHVLHQLNCTVGYAPSIENLVQMVGGAIIPGKPVANMYFTLYGYNTQTQTLNLLRDLKLVCASST
jgi:hypothetical protein